MILAFSLSMPLLASFIVVACEPIGARLVEGTWLALALVDFSPGRLPSVRRFVLLDGLVRDLAFGSGLAFPAFLAALAVPPRRPAKGAGAPPGGGWPESVRNALALYRGARRDHRAYVWLKVRMDPVYRLVCERLGEVGSVVDLGTGLALLPVLLAIRRQAEEIVAVEWDDAKLTSARLACSNLRNVVLHAADARSFRLPCVDVVCVVDLLHYYPVEEQRAILERAANALRPGGRLVIRETLASRGAGVRWTRLLERVSMRFRWNRGPGLVFRDDDDLVADLSGLGLECRIEGANSILHDGNVLIWAHKRG